MRKLRLLDPAEVETIQQPRRRVDLTEWRGLIQALPIGQWAELQLRPGETVWTVRRRITEVAQERGLRARFHKAPAGSLRFHLTEDAPER